MERFHQKLMEVMLVIKLTYAGNKLVELMHLNARVAKPNLSSSKKENSFFLAKEKRHFVLNLSTDQKYFGGLVQWYFVSKIVLDFSWKIKCTIHRDLYLRI